MSEVIGSVQVVVRPDTTNFAEKARDKIEKQFARKNALELDFEVDPDQIRRDIEDSHYVAQQWLNLKKNALKVTVVLDWKKTELLSQLRNLKSDVEALEKLQRPTVYANFEVDKRGLDKIREDVKLNVSIDAKTLQRSIEKATKDVTVFGDKKTIERNAKTAAELSSRVFQDILKKRKLKVEIDADAKKLEEAQVAMERALGIMVGHKSRLAELEDSLESVNKGVAKQAALVDSLNDEWFELSESGEANARQFSHYANSLREAEESLKVMVKEQERLRRSRDHHANNILAPSIDGADRLKREFDELERQLDGKKAEISAVAERTSFIAVATELNVMARDRIVAFHARVRKNSIDRLERQWGNISRHSRDLGNNVVKWIGQLAGVRVLWRTFRDMVDWLPRLDMMVPQIAQGFSLLTVAASGAVAALGMVFTLISDIGEVGKLALALPSVLAGAAGSIVILARAFHDFEEVFPEIVSYYERLGDTVSSKVWAEAAAPIRTLQKSLEPILNAQAPRWASAWGESLGFLAKGLGKKSALSSLQQFLVNSVTGTKKASKGWEHLGGAIASLLGSGSTVFGDLGTWFTETMASFEEWAVANRSNVGIWIREGGTALRELGSIAVSTVKIIAGVADAFEAAGWPGLTEFEAAMRSLSDAALNLKDSDLFMQTLGQVRYFFEQIGKLSPAFERSLGTLWAMLGHSAETMANPIALALAYIMDGFNSEKFQNGFGKFITGIASFVEDISPGLGAMTAEIGSLLGVVGTAAESWGPAFNEMLLLFASAGDELHPGLTDFVENLGPALLELVEDITPHVEDFSAALGDLLGDEDFQKLIGDLIGDLGTLGGWILQIGTWVINTARAFSDWYGTLDEGEQSIVRWSIVTAGAFTTVGLAGFLLTSRLFGIAAAIRAAAFVFRGAGWLIVGAVRVIQAALTGLGGFLVKQGGRLAVKGGILGVIGRILGIGGRGFLAAGGPLGWLMLVLTIPARWIAAIPNLIMKALGLDDTLVGRIVESISTGLSNLWGGKSFVGFIWDTLWEIFTGREFGTGEKGSRGGALWRLLKGISPVGLLEVLFKTIFDEIARQLGTDLNWDGLKAKAKEWLFRQVENIKTIIQGIWDGFKEFIENWTPENPLGSFAKWVTEKILIPIVEWIFGLGGDDDGHSGSSSSFYMHGDPAWATQMIDEFRAAAARWWTNIVTSILSWTPLKILTSVTSWVYNKFIAPVITWLLGAAPSGVKLGSPEWIAGVIRSLWTAFSGWWNNLWTGLMEWTPIRFLTSAWEWVKEKFVDPIWDWIFGASGEDESSLGEKPAWLTGLIDTVTTTLGSWWDDTKAAVEEWIPETTGSTGLAGKIWEGVQGILGGGTAGGDSPGTFGFAPGFLSRIVGVDPGNVTHFQGQLATANGSVNSLSSGVVRGFALMRDGSRIPMSEMASGTVSSFSGMSNDSLGQSGRMRSGTVSDFTTMRTLGAERAQALRAQFVGQMRVMATDSVAQARAIRSGLPAVLSFDTSGAGRRVGNSFVSGLSSGLSRAVGVARSMVGNIRSVLSINVHSSGASVGGSFASGLRSRISSVASAASALASAARSRMPNSPADEGPFSGSGWGGWGESIAEELARGLRMGAPKVAREASRMMASAAAELSQTSQVSFAPDVKSVSRALGTGEEVLIGSGSGTTVNVNVTSRSEDPLQDGNRFGGDIAFALRGAGLA